MHPTERGFARLRDEGGAPAVAPVDHHLAAAIQELRSTFRSGVTRSVDWRKRQLSQLIKFFDENTEAITDAVVADLGGPRLRGAFEMGAVEQAQIAMRSLDDWMREETIPWGSPFGRSVVRREPKGCVLVIAPWNFPLDLALSPVVGILAAGNVCVVKPSEVSTHCEALLAKLLPRYLPSDAVRVVTGGPSVSAALLEQRWDHIMYTGNGSIGRLVMAAAAEHLTPMTLELAMTLELGGKCPVIVDEAAKIGLTAKRIAQVKSSPRTGVEHVLSSINSGGASVNSTLEHATNPLTPIGVVGESGFGAL